MSTHIDVHPQRRVGNAWQACLDHAAQRFAVVSIKRLTINGALKMQVKVLAAFKTRAEALAVRDSIQARSAKRASKGASKARPEGLPQPGSRMPPRPEGVKVLASSLTPEESVKALQHVKTTTCQCKPYKSYICPQCRERLFA